MKLRYLTCGVFKDDKDNLIVADIVKHSIRSKAIDFLYSHSAYHSFVYDLVSKKVIECKNIDLKDAIYLSKRL